MKKFLKTVFFFNFKIGSRNNYVIKNIFYAFLNFEILTPYLMVLGKYLVGCTCQKSEKNVNILKLT